MIPRRTSDDQTEKNGFIKKLRSWRDRQSQLFDQILEERDDLAAAGPFLLVMALNSLLYLAGETDWQKEHRNQQESIDDAAPQMAHLIEEISIAVPQTLGLQLRETALPWVKYLNNREKYDPHHQMKRVVRKRRGRWEYYEHRGALPITVDKYMEWAMSNAELALERARDWRPGYFTFLADPTNSFLVEASMLSTKVFDKGEVEREVELYFIPAGEEALTQEKVIRFFKEQLGRDEIDLKYMKPVLERTREGKQIIQIVKGKKVKTYQRINVPEAVQEKFPQPVDIFIHIRTEDVPPRKGKKDKVKETEEERVPGLPNRLPDTITT